MGRMVTHPPPPPPVSASDWKGTGGIHAWVGLAAFMTARWFEGSTIRCWMAPPLAISTFGWSNKVREKKIFFPLNGYRFDLVILMEFQL